MFRPLLVIVFLILLAPSALALDYDIDLGEGAKLIVRGIANVVDNPYLLTIVTIIIGGAMLYSFLMSLIKRVHFLEGSGKIIAGMLTLLFFVAIFLLKGNQDLESFINEKIRLIFWFIIILIIINIARWVHKRRTGGE